MNILKKTITVGGMLAVAFAMSPALSGQAHAYSCKGNQYSGAATKNLKFQARKGARKSWEAAMKNQFDLSWSLWSIAAGKSISCHKTGSKHTCLALARPCQYVTQ